MPETKENAPKRIDPEWAPKPIDIKKSKHINMYLTAKDKDALAKIAFDRGLKLSQLLLIELRKYMARENQEEWPETIVPPKAERVSFYLGVTEADKAAILEYTSRCHMGVVELIREVVAGILLSHR